MSGDGIFQKSYDLGRAAEMKFRFQCVNDLQREW